MQSSSQPAVPHGGGYFEERTRAVTSQPGYQHPEAFAVGIATYSKAAPGRVLDVYFPFVNVRSAPGTAAIIAGTVGHTSGSGAYPMSLEGVDDALSGFRQFFEDHSGYHPNIWALKHLRTFLSEPRHREVSAYVEKKAVAVFVGDLSAPPKDAHDVYLRLHLLSARKVQPHGLNLDGVFGLLNNVVWTNLGPFDPESFEWVRVELRSRGVDVRVHSVDKFPRMTDYVVPTGVRIGDADRVRLGAYLSEGTTVMHEGFVNFNAGTLGASMVEGRISAGVVVGNGTDVGGSASIMGTLSGGGKLVISVGENCLLGANSGIGISLGDNCTVEAGLYVTAGSLVTLPDGRVVKAVELNGQSDLLFRRNSRTGAIEVLAKKNQVILNEALHANA